MQEVRRIAPEPTEKSVDEGALVLLREQGVRPSLLPDRAGGWTTGPRRAERSHAMRRAQSDLVAEVRDSMQRPILGPGQVDGVLGAGQIRTGRSPHDERTSGEDGLRRPGHEVSDMLGGVARRVQDFEGGVAEGNRVTLRDR